MQAAGIKPVDLRYLLQHQADDLANREIKDSWVTGLLQSLQAQYQAAFTDNKSPFDPGLTPDENKGALKDILSRLTSFSADDLTQFMRIADAEFLTPTGTVGAFIDDKLAGTVDTTAIKAAEVALAAAPSDGTRNSFIQSVLDALSAFFYFQAKGSALAQGVMAAFKTSESLTAALLLLAHLKEPAAAGGKTLAELLSSDDLVDKVNPVPAPPAVTPAAFPHQYEAVRLLSAMVPWLATLPLKPEDVAWMLAHNADLGWLELDRLPYQTGITSLSFSQWELFSDILAWIQAYPPVANPADPTQPYTSYMFFETVLNPAATLNDVANALAMPGRLGRAGGAGSGRPLWPVGAGPFGLQAAGHPGKTGGSGSPAAPPGIKCGGWGQPVKGRARSGGYEAAAPGAQAALRGRGLAGRAQEYPGWAARGEAGCPGGLYSGDHAGL